MEVLRLEERRGVVCWGRCSMLLFDSAVSSTMRDAASHRAFNSVEVMIHYTEMSVQNRRIEKRNQKINRE